MRTWAAGLGGLVLGGVFTAALLSALGTPDGAKFGSDAWQLIGAATGAFVSVMAAFGVVQYQEKREAARVRSFVLATIKDVIRAANRLGASLMMGQGSQVEQARGPDFWRDLTESAETLNELQHKAMNRLPRIEENLYKLDIKTLQTVFEVEDLLPALDPTINDILSHGKSSAIRMYGGAIPPGWVDPIGFYAGRLENIRRRLED